MVAWVGFGKLLVAKSLVFCPMSGTCRQWIASDDLFI